MTDKTIEVRIQRRPWYEWLVWAAWLFAVIFTLQNAIASASEYEPQAAVIFWGTEVVLLIGGAIVYYVRRQRLT